MQTIWNHFQQANRKSKIEKSRRNRVGGLSFLNKEKYLRACAQRYYKAMCVFESKKPSVSTELINFEPNLAILILL